MGPRDQLASRLAHLREFVTMAQNIIDTYLEDQQALTAVEKFTLQHDLRQLPPGECLYEELIPKSTPGPGQQYAFTVDLDRCTGCKACVTACHNENGLEEDETWRSVGLLRGVSQEGIALQHVTSACHHCLEPGCLKGCPVNAYEKDAATGIVKHLEDQCIGCQYCIFTCPYDVPKYNKKKGIVHKCDMCISRLEVGQPPACVRACPSGAIRISLVETASVKKNPQDFVRIPEAPDSRYTLPTTRYVSAKELPADMISMDFLGLKAQHSHWPLILMLIFTQLSAGAFIAVLWLQNTAADYFSGTLATYQVFVALGTGVLAMGASVFHLGRPLYAFRAVLGLKRSWLSREIVAFGAFAVFSAIYAFHGIPDFGSNGSSLLLAFTAAATGILGVFCSVMVYKDTHRPFWSGPLTAIKFFLTAAILGIATILVTTMVLLTFSSQGSVYFFHKEYGKNLCAALVMMTIVKLVFETIIFFHLRDRELTSLKKTALLMTGVLKNAAAQRLMYGALGGIIFPILFLALTGPMSAGVGLLLAVGIFLFSFLGELAERYLFFRAVVPLKMPGGN